jgi:hypothetical protein
LAGQKACEKSLKWKSTASQEDINTIALSPLPLLMVFKVIGVRNAVARDCCMEYVYIEAVSVKEADSHFDFAASTCMRKNDAW